MKILIVEDSPVLQRSLTAGLTNSGLTVDQAFDGVEAELYLQAYAYDIILLDLMLPQLSGLDVLKRLRNRGDKTYVLILSAKDEIEDRTCGLDMGADDYLIKPFSFDELLSRLRAQYRRVVGNHMLIQARISLGPVDIDTANRTVSSNGCEVQLTPSEYKILELLCSRIRQTFSHDQMIERLYRADKNITRNAIEAHVSTLRKKLRHAGAGNLVKTRRGFGYFVD